MNQAMDERHARIQAQHLERTAYVYVRQSSARQVIEHLESQRRQYDLVSWANAAGWPVEQVVVIDEDQGKSGSTAKTRPGFARLITATPNALLICCAIRGQPKWALRCFNSTMTRTRSSAGPFGPGFAY